MKTAALAALTTLALAGARAAAPAGEPAPLPLTLAGTGPYYTLTMDAPARRLSAAPGLADLRVRNAAGQAMAFAWVEPPLAASAPQRVPARLAKTAMPADAAASAGVAAPGQAWIVDTRDAGYDLVRLELGLERGTQGVWTLRLEASDDQQHWRTLQEDAQLVRLQALPQVGATGTLAPLAAREPASDGGVDLDDVPARYLRLTTAPRSAIPPLVSAAVLRAPHHPAAPPIDWSAPIAAARCEETSCDYPLPPNTPVAALQVEPVDVDTLVEVMVRGLPDAGRQASPRRSLLRAPLDALRLKSARAASQSGDVGWEDVAMASVYWLAQSNGAPELHSPPIRLDGGPWRALRLETLAPISQLGHEAPTIRIGVRRRSLVFEARGAAPFVLARARAGDGVVPLPLSALMPQHEPGAPLPESTATLAPEAAPLSASATSAASAVTESDAPRTATVLWGAVAAGIAVLAALAGWLWRRRARRSAATVDGRPAPVNE
jgi:hypothetical protein